MKIFSALLAICAGNSPVTGELSAQRPVTRSFDVFVDLCLNERLSKQSWGWWFETPSRQLWRHCNDDCHSANEATLETMSEYLQHKQVISWPKQKQQNQEHILWDILYDGDKPYYHRPDYICDVNVLLCTRLPTLTFSSRIIITKHFLAYWVPVTLILLSTLILPFDGTKHDV